MTIPFLTVKMTSAYKFYYLFESIPFFRVFFKPQKTTYRLCGLDVLRVKTDGSYLIDKSIAVKDKKSCDTVYINIGEFALRDSQTGIGRVIRSFLRELFNLQETLHLEIIPIYRKDGTYGYFYARRYVEKNFPEFLTIHNEIEFSVGSHFVEGVVDTRGLKRNYYYLQELKEHGVILHLFLYDLIPYKYPAFCTKLMVEDFPVYLEMSTIFPHVICDSKSVGEDYVQWKKESRCDCKQVIDFCYLSGDFENKSASHTEISHKYDDLLGKNFILSVSTLEPRKGYVKAIKTLESLWQDGFEFNYYIIGRKGWNYEDIVGNIVTSKFYGKKLYWFCDVSDADLRRFYQSCQSVFIPSEAEGFGLSLAEAAYYNKSVIVNNLDVFRELAPLNCYFLDLNDLQSAIKVIKKWYDDLKNDHEIKIDKSVFPSWEQSARHFIQQVLTFRSN